MKKAFWSKILILSHRSNIVASSVGGPIQVLPICCRFVAGLTYKIILITFVVWGFRNSVDDDYSLLVYDAFLISNFFSAFRRTLLPPHHCIPERSCTTLNMKAVSPSETSVTHYEYTRHYLLEDSNLRSQSAEVTVATSVHSFSTTNLTVP